jgi:DNA polymerase I-like protein with 3'-5' exonuclease and polymerase domains
MEHAGIPLDVETYKRLDRHWDGIRARLVAQYNPEFGVYDGLRFVSERFVDYLVREDIPWPEHGPGVLDLRDETFENMGEIYPQIERLRQLRKTMSKLRLNSIVLGADGRNRAMLGQFVASTGRNAHKASEFIFGPSRWLRGLIKPTAGSVLVYLDWSAQEFVIAAALSGDQNMLAAIASGDPYMWFAKMAKLVPEWATEETHPEIREICKRCCLGVLYGMGARVLSTRTKRSELEARELLDHHRSIFPTFWAWSGRAVREATYFGFIDLSFGWRIHHGVTSKGEDTSPTTLMNAPMQGNGSEMLRLAAVFARQAGLTVNAPLHDALMIEARAEDEVDATRTMRNCMNRASRLVLDGVEVKVKNHPVRWPDRYMDDRVEAKDMWRDAMGHLVAIEREARTCAQVTI